MEMAQLALQAGVPAEAKMVVDKGYAAGVLGKGAEAERQKRLKDLVDKHARGSARRPRETTRRKRSRPRTATTS